MARSKPQRTCIGCRRKGSKNTFLRLVRTASGSVAADPTGKAAGRGAYVCPVEECIERGINDKNLTRVFRLNQPEQPLNIASIKDAAIDAIRRRESESDTRRDDGHGK